MVIGLECSLRQVICGCGDPVAAHVRFIEAPSRAVWSVLVPRSRISGGTGGKNIMLEAGIIGEKGLFSFIYIFFTALAIKTKLSYPITLSSHGTTNILTLSSSIYQQTSPIQGWSPRMY